MSCLALLQACWADARHPSETIALTRPTLFVGRSQDSNLVVEHPAISGRHAEIRLGRGGATVRDMGSRNGTFLDGQRLAAGEEVVLPYSVTLRLHTCLELRLLPAPEDGIPPGVTPTRLYLVRQPQPGVIVVARDGTTRRLHLGSRRTVVGRSSTCDVVIDHPLVSHRHAEIVAQRSGQFTIEDLGSRNGFYYQGQRIRSRVLSPGEWLFVGAGSLDAAALIEFKPALHFVTEPGAAPAGSGQEATRMGMPAVGGSRLVTCSRCGAENFGPQVVCLRCRAPLPPGRGQ